ncbi:PadR family transcriptional regulator [Parasphingopyxis lamellibrachiae]|uniref:DNA-binding PadR family transcriptional regulator n=1 Tax=Parasphingopyxis lamellibrachiae TaxID=680125 RepID=A0A3D9FFI7_9SPHN|nr:PadR family transcriptional regulator [Parasphingopyxis lamellibrachiae]RED16307.1 DNA-binding PadR family transcriptional regulator [Parasphingopyxis lamellibrachiae]
MNKEQDPPRLSDHEGALLDLVRRTQPVTAYRIVKIFEMSPVAAFNSSLGQVYPTIKRLAKAGLVESVAVEGDARGTATWTCTKKGQEALRNWVLDIKSSHLLMDDPLRTKLMSFDLLTQEERILWLVDVKAELSAKLEEQIAYDQEVELPYQEAVHDNVVSSLRSRMDWLDRVLGKIVKSGRHKD